MHLTKFISIGEDNLYMGPFKVDNNASGIRKQNRFAKFEAKGICNLKVCFLGGYVGVPPTIVISI